MKLDKDILFKVKEWMGHHALGDDVKLSLCANSKTCIGQSLVMFFVCLFIANPIPNLTTVWKDLEVSLVHYVSYWERCKAQLL